MTCVFDASPGFNKLTKWKWVLRELTFRLSFMGLVYDKSTQVLENSMLLNTQHLSHTMDQITFITYFFEKDKEGRGSFGKPIHISTEAKCNSTKINNNNNKKKNTNEKSECRHIVNSGMSSIKQIGWWHRKKKLYTPLIKPWVADVSAGKT